MICVPRPRTNLPREYACRSHPIVASVSGFLPNATAIEVPSCTFSVCSAASSNGRKGSCAPSKVHMPSYPAASAAVAAAPMSRRSLTIVESTSMTSADAEQLGGVVVEDPAQPVVAEPETRAGVQGVGVPVGDVGSRCRTGPSRRGRRVASSDPSGTVRPLREIGERHRGVEPDVVEALSEVEELGILGHSHMRDDQRQSGEAFEQSRDSIGPGELARCRTGTAMDHHRDLSIVDLAPHAVEQRVDRRVGPDLNVRFEDGGAGLDGFGDVLGRPSSG